MIKVNLLPQRKAKRAARTSDASSKHLGLGIGAVAAAAAGVFLLVDRPRRSELSDLVESNRQLAGEIALKNEQLKGYAEMQKALEEADAREQSIQRLSEVKVVPAHVLHELGKILTTADLPTMTEEMAKKTGNGPESDSNKQFQLDWDPNHVWFSSFVDTAGAFKLEGGAQSESDVTQLAKRLAASVYFMEVSPAGGERVADRESGLNFYKFTITGKVAY
jgi:Tfp pilus assembly protein PilN